MLLRGYRSYNLSSSGILFGGYGSQWRKPEKVATCQARTSYARRHLLARTCQCGIYLKWKPEDTNILAVCLFGGAVVFGTEGARAEYVVIERLYIKASVHTHTHTHNIPIDNADAIAKKLKIRYDVSVEIVGDKEWAGLEKKLAVPTPLGQLKRLILSQNGKKSPDGLTPIKSRRGSRSR